jgi:hypothetical protein
MRWWALLDSQAASKSAVTNLTCHTDLINKDTAPYTPRPLLVVEQRVCCAAQPANAIWLATTTRLQDESLAGGFGVLIVVCCVAAGVGLCRKSWLHT